MLARTQLRTYRFLCRCYSTGRPFKQVRSQSSGDLKVEQFRAEYFLPGRPVLLRNHSQSIPAISKWFLPIPSNGNGISEGSKQLNIPYLEQYGFVPVPLELTRSIGGDGTAFTKTTSFDRFEAPLSLFLSFTSELAPEDPSARLYLAQCSIDDLPAPLRADLPMPDIVRTAGKGDIYASSIWLGRPPTRTPMHRDPNPNLFIQLAGRKVVRLVEPEEGRALYERVRVGEGHANLRGEEMMVGGERERIEEAVWGDGGGEEDHIQYDCGWEARLESGDALFIPLGWWHSVRGIGEGVTGSVSNFSGRLMRGYIYIYC